MLLGCAALAILGLVVALVGIAEVVTRHPLVQSIGPHPTIGIGMLMVLTGIIGYRKLKLDLP